MSNTRNENAVALFKEHLPPHLAEICIKAHEDSVKKNSGWLKPVNPITLGNALANNINWDYLPFKDTWEFMDENKFLADKFYTLYPELRPTDSGGNEDKGVSGDEPFEAKEIIDEHLPIREAEVSAEPMHSNETPQVGLPVVIRDIYRDMHQKFTDLHKQVDGVHYDVVKIKEVQNPYVIARLYDKYVSFAKSNSAVWNPVMRKNADSTLSMYTLAEFAKEHTWIMPLLYNIAAHEDYESLKRVVWHCDKEKQSRSEEFVRKLDNIEQSRRRYRSDLATKIEQLRNVKELEEEKASSTKSIAISIGILVVIDIIIHVFSLIF